MLSLHNIDGLISHQRRHLKSQSLRRCAVLNRISLTSLCASNLTVPLSLGTPNIVATHPPPSSSRYSSSSHRFDSIRGSPGCKHSSEPTNGVPPAWTLRRSPPHSHSPLPHPMRYQGWKNLRCSGAFRNDPERSGKGTKAGDLWETRGERGWMRGQSVETRIGVEGSRETKEEGGRLMIFELGNYSVVSSLLIGQEETNPNAEGTTWNARRSTGSRMRDKGEGGKRGTIREDIQEMRERGIRRIQALQKTRAHRRTRRVFGTDAVGPHERPCLVVRCREKPM